MSAVADFLRSEPERDWFTPEWAARLAPILFGSVRTWDRARLERLAGSEHSRAADARLAITLLDAKLVREATTADAMQDARRQVDRTRAMLVRTVNVAPVVIDLAPYIARASGRAPRRQRTTAQPTIIASGSDPPGPPRSRDAWGPS